MTPSYREEIVKEFEEMLSFVEVHTGISERERFAAALTSLEYRLREEWVGKIKELATQNTYEGGEGLVYKTTMQEILALLQPQEIKECNRCGLLKSTISATGKLCVSPSTTNIPPHDFVEDVKGAEPRKCKSCGKEARIDWRTEPFITEHSDYCSKCKPKGPDESETSNW